MWEELREELLLLHGHLRCSRLVQQGGGGAADTGDPQNNEVVAGQREDICVRLLSQKPGSADDLCLFLLFLGAAGYLTFTHVGISREPISCKQVSMLVHYVGEEWEEPEAAMASVKKSQRFEKLT